MRIFRKTNISTCVYKNGHNSTCDWYFFMKLAPLDSAHKNYQSMLKTKFLWNIPNGPFSQSRSHFEFDVWMISSTIELPCVLVSDRLLRWGDTALCLWSRHTPNNQEIMVQRCCYARIWHFHILRVNRKSIKCPWAEPFKVNVKIEQGSDFVVDNSRQLFFDAQEAKKVS